MTNQQLRARTAILPEFASMAMNAGEQLQDAQLSKGFVPMELQPLVDEAITGAAPTFSDRPLTDIELSTLDTWFVAHPEKIAGTQIAGSGYIAPIRTRGNMEDLERVFAFLDKPVVQSSEFNVQSEPAKEDWMLTRDEFLQKERLTDSYPIKDSMWERNVFAKHRNEVAAVLRFNKDKENGAWVERSEMRTAIKEGLINAENAIKVIESAGLEVPEDISKLVLNSQTANEKPTTIDKAKIKAKAKAKASAAALRLKRKNETV